MKDSEYPKMAAVEDEMWYYRALHGHLERALITRLGQGDARILDAGCGTGGLIRRLEERHPDWHWTGVDVSPLACELARARCGAKISEAAVEALPFPDGTFDAVVSADVLYHLDDDAAALGEIFRVLKPGGVVVINVPACQWLWSYHDEAVHGRRRYSRREMMEKLRAAGLRVEHLTHWNTLLFPLLVGRRKCLPAPRAGSDVARFNTGWEHVFDGAMKAERRLLQWFGRLPFGSSIFAVARKPAEQTVLSD